MTKDDPLKERRQHERKKYSKRDRGFEFFVQFGDDVYDILDVYDVSVSGIRMRLLQRIERGDTLLLTAKEDEFSMSVMGEVRWCVNSIKGQGYEHGVEFDTSDMDLNVLLFMSLKKHLQ